MTQAYPTTAAELAAFIESTLITEAEIEPDFRVEPEAVRRFVAAQIANAMLEEGTPLTDLLLAGCRPLDEDGIAEWLATAADNTGSDTDELAGWALDYWAD